MKSGAVVAMWSCSVEPTPAQLLVPIPDHPELAIGTLLSIIRQSGIARTAFES